MKKLIQFIKNNLEYVLAVAALLILMNLLYKNFFDDIKFLKFVFGGLRILAGGMALGSRTGYSMSKVSVPIKSGSSKIDCYNSDNKELLDIAGSYEFDRTIRMFWKMYITSLVALIIIIVYQKTHGLQAGLIPWLLSVGKQISYTKGTSVISHLIDFLIILLA